MSRVNSRPTRSPASIPEASFLEMLDQLNAQLGREKKQTIAFDSDCREGICGSCSLVIDGTPQGPHQVTSCQTYMRDFVDGATIKVEPYRAKRDAGDPRPGHRPLGARPGDRGRRLHHDHDRPPAGPELDADRARRSRNEAMDAAICIGCGACVAACPNGSAMLFTGAKVTHLNLLPQGQPERADRAFNMVSQMDEEGFGGCTNFGECSRVCPQEISLDVIGMLNREYRKGVAGPEAEAPRQDDRPVGRNCRVRRRASGRRSPS